MSTDEFGVQVTQYVCVFVQPAPERLLLIKKKRPQWQAGYFNLPGGKIEPGETPETASIRELYEETGIRAQSVDLMGQIIVQESHVVYYCHALALDYLFHTKTDELVQMMWMDEFLKADNVISNLKIAVPLMLQDMMGWVLRPAEKDYRHSRKWIVEL